MARHKSYGEILRDARERKRMDISDVSKRLRIRPDILHSIETSDFAHMPPRGYTRNMINAYANLVGLDPREITELYLDEAYRYETGSPRKSHTGNSSSSSQRSARSSENSTQRRTNRFFRSNSTSQRSSRNNFSSRSAQSTGRIQPARSSSDASFARRTNRMRNSQQRQDQRDTTNANSYPRLYSAPANTRSVASFITPQFLLVAALVVVIIILIISIAVAFGGSRESEEDVPNVPISGLTDTSGNSALEETPTTTDAAPTEATIVYEVVEDESAWIEISSDEETDFSFKGEVAGSYTSDPITTTGQVIFKTTDPDSVILKVNGEVVDLVSDGTDYYTYTIDFPTILAAWQVEHGLVATADDSEAGDNTAQRDDESAVNNESNEEDTYSLEDYSYDYYDDDDDDYSYSYYSSSDYDYDDDDYDYDYDEDYYDYVDDDDDYYDYDNEDYDYDENDYDEDE